MDNKIKKCREYYGLSQRELAKKVGISSSQMNYIEANLRIPNVYTGIRIARILNSTVEKLFGGEEYSE